MTYIFSIWNTGFVRRWNANENHKLQSSHDSTDAHSARMVKLCIDLHPKPSADLLGAIIHHDSPEFFLGDLPYGSKKGDLGNAYKVAEKAVFEKLELPVAKTEEDRNWVRFLDRLDAWLYCRRVAPELLSNPDWIEAQLWLTQAATDLGVLLKWRHIQGEI